ncbi:hypothetical protein [Saccharopolyspora phatthalungensis]|uniref:Uncharacterized protein n=1 Tax=Saccharopolyspora phatthalungensis TaxID=664693 RepID=A0A840Q6T8_9PSEU|nr:hypothetical protein [Saccharopolyspora phatthalungensis]MBB5156354.1 hypothetical protein [Saccharopolyspora phatthalungensis]
MMVSVQHDPATTRAAIRAFVRAHHPDVGGDPEVFATGLMELRAAQRTGRRPRDRYDAPVVVVNRPRGLRRLLHRIRSWQARRKRAPRVR